MTKVNFVGCLSLKSQNSSPTLKIKFILWWICAISLTGMFVWECYKTIDDFVKQPYVTSLKAVENGSIELPVIRICPSNWINYTALKEQNVTLQQLEMLMEGFTDSYVEEHFEDSKSYLEDEFNQFIKERPNFDFANFFREQISLKCSQIFHFCRWQSTYYNCCDGENVPFNARNPLINAGQCYLIYKQRFNPKDANFRQSVSGPGGGLMIHMSLPTEESEVPGLTVSNSARNTKRKLTSHVQKLRVG